MPQVTKLDGFGGGGIPLFFNIIINRSIIKEKAAPFETASFNQSVRNY
jgi:hypothetical protein